MNEFVARKGLISSKSSSFEETLFVSGSIYSPAEAFLTASWALNATSSSYVDSPFFTLQSVVSSSLTTSPTGTLLRLSNFLESKSTNLQSVPFVTSSFNDLRYGCTKTGWYDFNFECQFTKANGPAASAGIALVFDGVIENGTYKTQTIISNTTEYGLSSNVRKFVNSGSIVYPSVFGTVTNISTVIPTKLITGMANVGGPKFTINLVK